MWPWVLCFSNSSDESVNHQTQGPKLYPVKYIYVKTFIDIENYLIILQYFVFHYLSKWASENHKPLIYICVRNKYTHIYIYIYIYSHKLLDWVYGISTFVSYLRPNPFLYALAVLFQTIQFRITTQFNCQNISISSYSV